MRCIHMLKRGAVLILTAQREPRPGRVSAKVVGDLAHIVADVFVLHVDDGQHGAVALHADLDLPRV